MSPREAALYLMVRMRVNGLTTPQRRMVESALRSMLPERLPVNGDVKIRFRGVEPSSIQLGDNLQIPAWKVNRYLVELLASVFRLPVVFSDARGVCLIFENGSLRFINLLSPKWTDTRSRVRKLLAKFAGPTNNPTAEINSPSPSENELESVS